MSAESFEPESVGTVSDLRNSERIGVRTPVLIYEVSENGTFTRYRGWTDNLSATGAKLVIEKPLSGSLLFLRIMLPDFKDQILKSELIRDASGDALQQTPCDRNRFCYGVRFIEFADHSFKSAIELADEQGSQVGHDSNHWQSSL
jgi:hypothetical protein